MKLSLNTKNVPDVVRRLRAYSPAARKAIRATIGEYAAKEYQLAYDLCPKDTFFMVDHLRIVFSKGGYTYRLGWQRNDFTSAGLAFYPWFQELGFRHYVTKQFIQNPCIVPARNVTRPKFEAALARVLRQAAAGTLSSRYRSARATARRVA